jgi:hypothetical protein
MNHGMRIVMLVSAVLAGALMQIATAAPQGDSTPRSTQIEHRPEFRCVAPLLQTIVEDAGSRGPQRLYIGPMEREGAAAFVRVYWPQARAILLVDWPASCSGEDMRIDDAVLGWYRTKARIDLDTDVVPTPEDIGGSTYLVDRVWVNRVIVACRRGHLLVVEARIRN